MPNALMIHQNDMWKNGQLQVHTEKSGQSSAYILEICFVSIHIQPGMSYKKPIFELLLLISILLVGMFLVILNTIFNYCRSLLVFLDLHTITRGTSLVVTDNRFLSVLYQRILKKCTGK